MLLKIQLDFLFKENIGETLELNLLLIN